MASLLAGPGKMMMERDLWHMVDIVVSQAFVSIGEQLVHHGFIFSSYPPNSLFLVLEQIFLYPSDT